MNTKTLTIEVKTRGIVIKAVGDKEDIPISSNESIVNYLRIKENITSLRISYGLLTLKCDRATQHFLKIDM